MKKIGLVGGLSWVSTLEYYKLINVFTNQSLGGHKSAHVLIESLDEGLFLDNQNNDPTEKLCEKMIVDAVDVLVSGGAEVVALCANGLHRFMPAMKDKYDVEFVDIRDATAKAIQSFGLDRVGLIGVQKTMETEFL
ncbi:aspartate/glutamate racemase family protein [Vibrio metschnikovii]